MASLLYASADEQLCPWLSNASQYGGSFIREITAAAFHADADNYELLRPLLLELQRKYPQYDRDRLCPEV